jgi:hypothetical protein
MKSFERAIVNSANARSHHTTEIDYRGPVPNAAAIEARKAHDRAAANPLGHCFGEPLPGRSALDKMRAAGRTL